MKGWLRAGWNGDCVHGNVYEFLVEQWWCVVDRGRHSNEGEKTKAEVRAVGKLGDEVYGYGCGRYW